MEEVLHTINQEIRGENYNVKEIIREKREREELAWWLRCSTRNKRVEVRVLLPLKATRDTIQGREERLPFVRRSLKVL